MTAEQQIRADALEQAAKLCEELNPVPDIWINGEPVRYEKPAWMCARDIRAMIERERAA